MDAFEALSVPGPSPVSGKKYFTPAEASRALPLVRRIVSDIVRDYLEFRELHAVCQAPRGKGKKAEAEKARARYLSLSDRLSELKEELDKIGCELKDYQQGLIDFPGILEGREVSLCWKLGEEKVAHWHEVEAGFAGRAPITEEMFGL